MGKRQFLHWKESTIYEFVIRNIKLPVPSENSLENSLALGSLTFAEEQSIPLLELVDFRCYIKVSSSAIGHRHLNRWKLNYLLNATEPTLWVWWLFGLVFNSPVNTIKDISSGSVYLTTPFLSRLCPLSGLTVLGHVFFSPETDKYPFWISEREWMTVESISWSISMMKCCWTWRGSNRDLLITIRLSHRCQLRSAL